MKTTEEKNRMIAEFVGHESSLYKGSYHLHKIDKPLTSAEDLKFHTSWDWLMEVVEKIDNRRTITSTDESYLYCVSLNGCNGEISDGKTGDVVSSVDNQIGWKEMVYELVVKFIEWYNENK